MTVEIRELIIRANVVNSPNHSDNVSTANDNNEIIAACVEQVLTILERRKER